MNKKGSSIIEVMVVIVILTVGIMGAYEILYGGQKLAVTTENRIKAINIAREGIEAVQNMRDTNWLKFSSDYTNCWNTLNYATDCINTTGYGIGTGSYILDRSGSIWVLSGVTDTSTNFDGYIGLFPVYYDSDGLVTQTSTITNKCDPYTSTSCIPGFSREITISYLPNNEYMEVHSIVKWIDSALLLASPHIIDLKTVLTNWKKGL